MNLLSATARDATHTITRRTFQPFGISVAGVFALAWIGGAPAANLSTTITAITNEATGIVAGRTSFSSRHGKLLCIPVDERFVYIKKGRENNK